MTIATVLLPCWPLWPSDPGGLPWPGPDTLVLAERELRPDTDLSTLSRFADDVWDLNAAIFEEHQRSGTLNFTLIPAELRQATKLYIWLLINRGGGRLHRREAEAALALGSIRNLFTSSLQFVLEWLAARGITQFDQVSSDVLDDYLEDLKVQIENDDTTVETCARYMAEIRRLWTMRDILPEPLRLPPAPPWGGEEIRHLLGGVRRLSHENKTRRIDADTMQTLLSWALRFIDDFSEDILAAHAEFLTLHDRSPEMRRFYGTVKLRSSHKGQVRPRAEAYLQGLRLGGGTLPGQRTPDGTMAIRWRHLAMFLDCAPAFHKSNPALAALVRSSGVPIGDDTYLHTPITGLLDGQPWRSTPITFDEAPRLARLLSTACFIVIAYLSGARAGELLNLQRGCISRDDAADLWLMEGRYFKGATDEYGNKIPEGQVRPEPWVVIHPVVKAVDVVQRIHNKLLLFPSRIEPHLAPKVTAKRKGESRDDITISADIQRFVAWVNQECAATGRDDVIRDDGTTLTPSRFRRTLAWFIRRRPRGLIANAIQYGHAHVEMTQGYAGSFESGFPDEYAHEDYLFRLEALAEDERALADGEHVSGKAADAYRYRVEAASKEFAGRVLVTERQSRDLVGNTLLQIHHGEGMTCVFNAATAPCQIRGTIDDPMVTPDTDDCRPNCPNLARTDRDIAWNRRKAAELQEIVDDPLAPEPRNRRDRAELQRLKTIIAEHDKGAEQ